MTSDAWSDYVDRDAMARAPRHRCADRSEVERAVADTSWPSPREWGPAIGEIVHYRGAWWALARDASPPEYSTPIRVCPFCGELLEGPSELAPNGEEDPAEITSTNRRRVERLRSLPDVEVRQEGEDLVVYHDGNALFWQNPDRVSGQVCLHGTRLPVSVPLAALAEGAPLDEVAQSWPSASPEGMARLLRCLCYLIDPAADW